MKFVDEFRDPAKARSLISRIQALRKRITTDKALQIMEFCGGHTHTIFRYGLEPLLPEGIELVHGPGCPVCVLPRERVDEAVTLAECPDILFTTFGDALRVPGSHKNLLQARAEGADVRMVYSPLDALELARQNPEREVVFFALGFETTMPSTAFTILKAEREEISNFSLLCSHVTTAPILKALLDSPDLQLDGFLAPGHVSMVIGEQPFHFVAKNYRKPIVITGFEPLDILQALWMVIRQIADNRAEVENQYTRVVRPQGNFTALAALATVFEPLPVSQWRGLGMIGRSGVRLRETYARFDAERKFTPAGSVRAEPDSLPCGKVLRGVLRPWKCPAYGRSCTPATPLGPLMVSSEGACAAYYQYQPKKAS